MSPVLDWFMQPFAFEFMQKAFIITFLLSVPMAVLSCFLVLKGWSLMGDAISHAVLPGIVLAYIVGAPLAAGAFAAGMACAMATGFLDRNSRIKQDTVMGVVFSGMFGLGLVMYVAIQTEVHLDHILFGNILGLTWGDVTETAVISIICSLGMAIWRKDLLLHAFDAQHARAIGLKVQLLHYGLLAAISLAIVGALKASGIILAIALLIAPGAIAFLVTRRFETMLGVAVAVAVGSSLAGVFASFHLDSAPAPTIVLVMTGLFIAAFIRQQMRFAKLSRQPRQSSDPTPS
ncbi:iron chelate uptake ABC transporter family permease subunit [Anderseniella sp. Alg231-50]|uniref:iron chelate uptake ABC transporter family permease subunit n=1 Tax=Anderseniella sp. Alg231-50 TaxID=1922226 RepID=UPI000D55F89B